jgi:hypothetical protein
MRQLRFFSLQEAASGRQKQELQIPQKSTELISWVSSERHAGAPNANGIDSHATEKNNYSNSVHDARQ